MAASSVTLVPLTINVESQVAGVNPRRKAIAFCFTASTAALLRPDPAGNVTGGIAVSANAGLVRLSVEQYGDLVKGPWFAFTTSGGQVLAVIETID